MNAPFCIDRPTATAELGARVFAREHQYCSLFRDEMGNSPSVSTVHSDLHVEPVLHNVGLTGTQLGVGGYYKVEEAEVGGTMCAAKSLHNLLIETVSPEQAARFLQRFASQCKMMSILRHPHIVTFLGTSYLNELPAILMEKLPYRLDGIVEHCGEIPLSLKGSILGDVARGLIYLHTLSIIHRDISPLNILLTSGLEAKIGSFGSAKYIMRGDLMEDALTQGPGTTAFMPPEALESRPVYGIPLDIFSFGCVALYTLTQEFPCDITAPVFIGPNDVMVVRSEVERRQNYFALLHSQLHLDCHHPLVQMIEQCLSNDSKERPTAETILEIINKVNTGSEQEQLSDKIKTMEMIMKSGDQEVNKEIGKVPPYTCIVYKRIHSLRVW